MRLLLIAWAASTAAVHGRDHVVAARLEHIVHQMNDILPVILDDKDCFSRHTRLRSPWRKSQCPYASHSNNSSNSANDTREVRSRLSGVTDTTRETVMA